MADGQVLTIHEAAAYLGVHPQTLRKLARRDGIPSFKVGRRWRFRKVALDQWAESRLQQRPGPLVLLADDEKCIRETVSLTLQEAGCRVITTANGTETVLAVRARHPDLLILDLAMPGLSGVQVLRELHGDYAQLPVIVLTGYPSGALMHEALQYAPLMVIAKPAKPEQVVAAVRRAVGQNL